MADEASSWNDLHGRFDVARIDHGQAYSLDGGVYTNGAEEFFSRMRRAEIGHRHHVAGHHLIRYVQEAAWREDQQPRSGRQGQGTRLPLNQKPHGHGLSARRKARPQATA